VEDVGLETVVVVVARIKLTESIRACRNSTSNLPIEWKISGMVILITKEIAYLLD
jgi:hypothetical protein